VLWLVMILCLSNTCGGVPKTFIPKDSGPLLIHLELGQ
jgi:hypothetical protein